MCEVLTQMSGRRYARAHPAGGGFPPDLAGGHGASPGGRGRRSAAGTNLRGGGKCPKAAAQGAVSEDA